MIRIHNPIYDIDVTMSARESGSVIEFLLDTMEARIPDAPAETPSVYRTEIIPEPFGTEDPRGWISVTDSDKAYFTGGEWRLLGRLLYLLRSELVCPNLRVNAWVKDDGTRGVQLLTADRSATVTLPNVCSREYLLKAVMQKTADLYRNQKNDAEN